jgi:hypothetical protein
MGRINSANKSPAAAQRQRRNAAFTITKREPAGAPKLRQMRGRHGDSPASPHHAAAFSWLKHVRSRRQGFIIFNLPLRATPWTPDTARTRARELLGVVAGGNDPFSLNHSQPKHSAQ